MLFYRNSMSTATNVASISSCRSRAVILFCIVKRVFIQVHVREKPDPIMDKIMGRVRSQLFACLCLTVILELAPLLYLSMYYTVENL